MANFLEMFRSTVVDSVHRNGAPARVWKCSQTGPNIAGGRVIRQICHCLTLPNSSGQSRPFRGSCRLARFTMARSPAVSLFRLESCALCTVAYCGDS